MKDVLRRLKDGDLRTWGAVAFGFAVVVSLISALQYF